jgi:hypothetical protein
MTIEERIRDYLLDLAAVSAITTTIRTDKLDQNRDNLKTTPAIVIAVEEEEFENTLDGRCDMVTCTIAIGAVSTSRVTARNLAEMIRTNNTNPGTGLAGAHVTSGALPFSAVLMSRSTGFVPNEDGSDSGIFSSESKYYVVFYQVS